MIDALEPKPFFVYIFGSFGGPYKVGYTSDPDRRFKEIVGSRPGCDYAGASPVEWLSVRCENRSSAKALEDASHRALSGYRVRQFVSPSGMWSYRREACEWFNAPLPFVIDRVKRLSDVIAGARCPRSLKAYMQTITDVVLSDNDMQRVNDFRIANAVRGPWGTSRPMQLDVAIRRLVEIGLRTSEREIH